MKRGFWPDLQATAGSIVVAWPLELFLLFMAATHPWLAWLLVSLIVGGTVALVWMRLHPADGVPLTPTTGPGGSPLYRCPECGNWWPSDSPPADPWRCPRCWQAAPAQAPQ